MTSTQALWDASFIALWTLLFFGAVWGSVLAGINWHRLGFQKKARIAWGFALLSIVLPLCITWDLMEWIGRLGSFMLWMYTLGFTQIEHFIINKEVKYRKAGWLVPVAAGLVVSFSLKAVGIPSASGLATLLYTPAQTIMSVEQVTQSASPYVVSIETSWEESTLLVFTEKRGKTGSGVRVSTTPTGSVIVTNRHVVEEPKGARNVVRSIFMGNTKVPYEVVQYAKNDLDLAILKVADPRADPAQTIAYAYSDDVHVGEECVAIGNALGAGISVTTGIVSRFDDYKGTKLIRTSAPISPGNSGGGLFRRRDGRLIGITTATRIDKGAQNVNLAIPVDYIFSEEDP